MLKKYGLFIITLFFTQYLFSQTPTVTSFSPTTAGPGDTLIINGTNLNGAIVNVNCNLTIISNITTQIQGIICIGALSGNVDIVTGHGSVIAPGFTVKAVPVIYSVVPDSATVGQTVTITGKYIGIEPPTIRFGGVAPTSITVVSNNVVKAVIGNGATGTVYLTNCCFGTTSSYPFTYLLPMPVINSFTPLFGTNGSSITIKGQYFTGATAVSIGGNPVQSFSVVSDTVITATVGIAASGNVAVTTGGGTVSIPGFFVCSNTYNTISVSICDNKLPYIWFGIDYNGAGSYTNTINNVGGCDSIITLNLKVIDTTQSLTQVNICSNLLPYTWNGNVFAKPGYYEVNLTSSSGCDSIANLNLQTHSCTPPLITSLSSMAVGQNDTLFIYGKYFTGATSVTFGGKHEYFYVESDSVIDVGLDSIVSNGTIIVTTPLGSDSIIGLSYIYPPVINSFYPTTHVGVDSSITIYGKNFNEVNNITFGGLSAVSFTTVSDSVITAVVGTGRSGNIMVTTHYGTGSIAGFLFQPAPVIHSYSPTLGGHGTAITIKGIYFTGTTNVYFGGVAVDSFYEYADSIIIAYVGTGDSGNVTVQTLYGADSLSGFTFIPPPLIDSFSPIENDGTGMVINIAGKYFTSANVVSFGGTNAQSFTVISDSAISATIGRGASGNIAITTPYGKTTFAGFVYVPYPVIYSFSPDTGGSGSIVAIRGLNFTGSTNVSFGGTIADSFSVVSDTVIKAVLGAGSTGNISVTNPYGMGTLGKFIAIPTISSFIPVSGAVGTTVTIIGTNFDSVAANNIVYFGAVRAKVMNANAGTLSVVVPVGATYQPISVTTNMLTAYAQQAFDVTFATGNIGINSFVDKKDIVVGTTPGGILISDFDGDGKPDIGVEDSIINISLFRNSSSPKIISTASPYIFKPGFGPYELTTTDLNGDGKQDLVFSSTWDGTGGTANSNNSSIGNISFSSDGSITIEAPGTFNIAVGDLDGDGKPDIAITANYSPNVYILRNTTENNIVSFAAPVQYYVQSSGDFGIVKNIYIADIDGDGKPELIIGLANYYLPPGGAVEVYKNISKIDTISFSPQLYFSTGSFVNSIAIGDLDGDGKPDLAIGYNNLSILKNTSTSNAISFSPVINYPSIPASGVTIADLDGDGKPDLAVTATSDSVTVVKNMSTLGSISFVAKAAYSTGFGIAGIAVGDIDGDGKPDIILSNAGTNTISILRNQVDEPILAPLCPPVSNTSLISYTTGSSYQWQLNTGNGFNNVSTNNNYADVNTDTLQLANIPSSWYGYQYRCVVDGNNSDVYTLQVTDIWTGAANDSSWQNSLNWSCGTVPDNNTDVIISSGTVILSTSTTVRSLTVNPTASFTITTPYNLIVTH